MSHGLLNQNGKDQKGRDLPSYCEGQEIDVLGLKYLFENYEPNYREEIYGDTIEESIYYGPIEAGQAVRIKIIKQLTSGVRLFEVQHG